MPYSHLDRALRATLLAVALGMPACVPGGPTDPTEDETNDQTPVTPTPAPEAPDPGAITVGLSTSGAQMPDSLTVRLDGAAEERVPASGSVTWQDLAPGDYLVRVADLPDNCAADGENPRAVSVASGGSELALFAIACSSTLGAIRVRISTTGDHRDEDGYRVEVKGDGVSLRRDVELTADLSFPDLPPGDYEVKLRDVDKECDVAEDDARELAIGAGEALEVTFSVVCDD